MRGKVAVIPLAKLKNQNSDGVVEGPGRLGDLEEEGDPKHEYKR